MGTYQNEELSKYLYVLFHYYMETHVSPWTGKQVVDGCCTSVISQKHLDSDTIASSNPH